MISFKGKLESKTFHFKHFLEYYFLKDLNESKASSSGICLYCTQQNCATSPGSSMCLLSQPDSGRNMVGPCCSIIQKQSVVYINDLAAVRCVCIQGKKRIKRKQMATNSNKINVLILAKPSCCEQKGLKLTLTPSELFFFSFK